MLGFVSLNPHEESKIPLALSMISAGAASEVVEDFCLIDVNSLITGGREGFIAFEVTGESMVDYIHPGNIVFCDTWAEPQNGDAVACDVDGATCVKIFERRKTGLFLVSANRDYPERQITARDGLRILGVVKAHLALHRR